ncbi:MAG: DUF3473 domain-containing protein [Gemmatimonadota bacterium]|nr:DUF3473 domain-containing protein [Gemmatimonadota bacterium]
MDVEDYFHVHAMEHVAPRSSWGSFPSRVEHNVERLLETLAAHNATGTFFVLAWVADRYPELVQRIAAGGHEIASHGWWHRKLTTVTPARFREDVKASKHLLEDLVGKAVLGYRAPSFSIVPGGEWAFDVLLEVGYQYDSSLFPIRRPGYGYPDAPPVPHVIHRAGGSLFQFPLATTTIASVRIPAAGGGYLRHFPYAVVRRAFRESEQAGVPAVFYIHPWEIDADQPRLPCDALTALRHYRGLSGVLPKIQRLLSEFDFTSVRQVLHDAARWDISGEFIAHERRAQ